MVRFYNGRIGQTEYKVRGIASISATSTVITPIAPARPKATAPVAASQFVKAKSNVGVSSNVYDVVFATDLPDPDIDLGVLYSNGTRSGYDISRYRTD
jgi:hypothetical protein